MLDWDRRIKITRPLFHKTDFIDFVSIINTVVQLDYIFFINKTFDLFDLYMFSCNTERRIYEFEERFAFNESNLQPNRNSFITQMFNRTTIAKKYFFLTAIYSGVLASLAVSNFENIILLEVIFQKHFIRIIEFPFYLFVKFLEKP